MRPPSASRDSLCAAPQPEMVPATVLAAMPPRNGMLVVILRSRYQSMEAACAAAPQASMAPGALPGTDSSQKLSPPMEFMCG